MVAGGQGGISKAALLTLRVMYASAVIVRLGWPLIPSHIRVWTEAVFAFSSCGTIFSVAKDGSVLLLPSVVRTTYGFFCVI
jgi:hypothetical protein